MGRRNKSLMRSLGEFVGHITRAVRSDPSREKHTVRSESVEQQQETSEGVVTLRRTTIEEVEIRRDDTAR